MIVSSHAPARGHLEAIADLATGLSCFKSCPRKGASPSPSGVRVFSLVSSHAPARGHPLQARLLICYRNVSSHAPARGHL